MTLKSIITPIADIFAAVFVDRLKAEKLLPNVSFSVSYGADPAAPASDVEAGLADIADGRTTSLEKALSEVPPVAAAHNPERFDKEDIASPAFAAAEDRLGITIKAGTVVGSVEKTYTFGFGGVAVILPKLRAGTDYAITLSKHGKLNAHRLTTRTPEPGGRVLGGFHVDLGGKILPGSIWDLKFRPDIADRRGMVFIPGANPFWCDIYLMSRRGLSLAGAAIADGWKFKPLNHSDLNHATAVEILAKHGKQLLSRAEFALAADGVEQGLTSKGKQAKTGRVKGLASRHGLEQATGTLWIWSREKDGDGWPYILGGCWGSGGFAGPSLAFGYRASYSFDFVGARGRCDHLQLA